MTNKHCLCYPETIIKLKYFCKVGFVSAILYRHFPTPKIKNS